MKHYSGRFNPQNPKKYRGNPANIWYRSSWELKFMMKIDVNPDVLEWQSEELIIPYRSPVDNRIHRYFPDFLVKVRAKDGATKILLIEIKPKSQTEPPKPKKGKRKATMIREIQTYAVNQAKFRAADAYCQDKKWTFKVLTERELGITNK